MKYIIIKEKSYLSIGYFGSSIDTLEVNLRGVIFNI